MRRPTRRDGKRRGPARRRYFDDLDDFDNLNLDLEEWMTGNPPEK